MRGDNSSLEELALDEIMDAFPTVRERKAEYMDTCKEIVVEAYERSILITSVFFSEMGHLLILKMKRAIEDGERKDHMT